MSGTDGGYGATRYAVLLEWEGGRTLLSCYAAAMRCPVLTQAILLSACAPYAMSGTDIAYGTTCLRASYSMSGTDIA
eukprot:2891103-Rhodomonas_salina.1